MGPVIIITLVLLAFIPFFDAVYFINQKEVKTRREIRKTAHLHGIGEEFDLEVGRLLSLERSLKAQHPQAPPGADPYAAAYRLASLKTTVVAYKQEA